MQLTTPPAVSRYTHDTKVWGADDRNINQNGHLAKTSKSLAILGRRLKVVQER